uniref:Hedgehog/Intein (Hint) domain-containing protein n=1 Tax=viral metagenome TaxID=1070528 RepID=A0A6C0I8B1_9ZZZZ
MFVCYFEITTENTRIHLPIRGNDIKVSWGNESVSNVSHIYSITGLYKVTIEGITSFGNGHNTWQGVENLISVSDFGNDITNLSGAFNGAINLESVPNKLPSTLTNLSFMFYEASKFNEKLMWNISSVTDLSYMFYGASSFNQNLSQWNFENVEKVDEMLCYSGLSTDNFNKLLKSLSNQNLHRNLYLGADKLSYDSRVDQHIKILKSNFNFNIKNAKKKILQLQFDIIKKNTFVRLPLHGPEFQVAVTWGDESDNLYDVVNEDKLYHTYKITGQFTVIIYEVSGSYVAFGKGQDSWEGVDRLVYVNFISNLITNLSGAFNGAINLKDININDLPTDVTDASYIFANTGDIINVNDWYSKIKITNSSGMYKNSKYNKPLASNLLSNVTDATEMFMGNQYFNQNISHLKLKDGIILNSFLESATAFNNGQSGNSLNWGNNRPSSLVRFLKNAESFSQIINIDTSSVTDMTEALYNAKLVNQDLGQWNIRNVTDMTGMLSFSGLSVNNYDSTLVGWSGQLDIPLKMTFKLQRGVSLGAEGLFYSKKGKVGRDILIDQFNWNIYGDTLIDVVCYSKGTRILCEHGYVPIEQLKVGMLVKTYKHGLREIELVGKGSFINDPSNWKRCMYLLPKSGEMTDDLVVTGGHGILEKMPQNHIVLTDQDWFFNNKKYSVIDGMYVSRAAFNYKFKKIESNDFFEYYHIALKSNSKWSRYGIWANGVLSESTFKHDIDDKMEPVL